MQREKLHKTLQELQLEVEKIHFDHESKRASVNQSLLELENRLRDESFMSGDEYLVHELQEALEHFEEDHPRITILVGQVSDLLAKMGI